MRKYKIIQQYFKHQLNNGGPATGAKLLVESSLGQKYDFIEMTDYYRSFFNLKLFLYYYKTIKLHKPDIVHIRGIHLEGFWGVVACNLLNVKVVMSVHGLYADARLGKLKKFLFTKIIEPYAMRHADLVYCVCNYAANRNYIKNNTKNLYGYIHNAAPSYPDVSYFEKESAKLSFGFDKNDIIVSLVSRVTKDKGFEVLKDSIFDLLDHNKNVKIIVAGDGPYLSEFRNACQKWIESKRLLLLGKTDRVKDVLKASDIFLFPTLHENLSNALLEACAMGVAIIATNVGGNPEVIKNHETGILIDPNSGDQIINAVNLLVYNAELRTNLADNAKSMVRTKFSQKEVFSKIDKAYMTLLK